MKHKKIVGKEEKGERLDRVITSYFPQISRSYFQFLIKNKKATVENQAQKPSFRVKEGDLIEWEDYKKEDFLETSQKLDIVFQNSDLLVISKPAGIKVHPGETLKPREEVTLVDILIKEFPHLKKTGGRRPGIVHRLDKDTSGLLIIAKTPKMLEYLKKEFKLWKVKKVYRALLYGKLEPKEGVIEAPIGRNPLDESKMAVVPENKGRSAITLYKVLEYLPPGKDKYTLVEAQPLTGRTHQLRVHFSSIGHPVVGDKTYGPQKAKERLERQFLHALFLGFKLPDGEYKKFKTDLPEDLKNFLKSLK